MSDGKYLLPPGIHAVSVEMNANDNIISALIGELIEADELATRARWAVDKAETLAFAQAQGAMELRKNAAKVAAIELEFEARMHELRVRALKARLKDAEGRADTLGKIGNSIKTEMTSGLR